MAVMDDFARMPTQRKVFVFAIAGAALFGLYYQLALKPLNSKLAAAKADHASKQALYSQYDGELPTCQTLEAKMAKLQRILDAEESALPTAAELPAFFEMLDRKVQEAGVVVKSSDRQPEQEVESFVKDPVNFEITGTFMQLKKFFASLATKPRQPGADAAAGTSPEERERIVSIENLKISDPEVVNHELVLHAKFTATTYREEAPPQEPVRAKAAPAPAKGATLPPADTPQGAKQRVDDSMKKDESRTRNAPGNPAEDSAGSAKLKGGVP